MARTVADVALLLSAIAGPDPRSPIALDDPGSVFAAPLERDFRWHAGRLEPRPRRPLAGRPAR